MKIHFDAVTGPLIPDNFLRKPSAGPAFTQLAAEFFDELARNALRLPQVKAIDVSVRVIWGGLDPYITAVIAKDRVSHFKNGTFQVLPSGYWVQSDLLEQVAKEMLS